MRKMISGRLTTANCIAAVAVFIALGGGAYAASTSTLVGSGGVITGCVSKKGGTLKVAKAGHGCPKGKVALPFDQRGPAGATGPTGTAGAPNPSATTVDGETVTKLFLKEPTPASSMTILPLVNGINGLTIDADCDNGGNASLVANGPASNDGDLTFSDSNEGGPDSGGDVYNLGSSSAQMLGNGGYGYVSFSYTSSAGGVVSGEIGYQKSPSLGTFNGCAFFGTVFSG